jgi:methyl-accepting chemotaxis protein
MTPEEEKRSNDRLDRIERSCEFLADNQARLSSALHELTHNVTELAADVRRTSIDVAKTADAVASLVRLIERHTGDGHGGKERS